MKSLNAKRIAAIVTGAALLGAGLAFAGPVTFQNVPIISNSGQPVVQVVIGSSAKPSDGVAAGNIAAAIGNLAYTSTPVTAWVNPNSTSGLTVAVSSAKYSLANQEVWLNETGAVGSQTGSTFGFDALIGSVLNQGVQLGSPQYTKSLQATSSYAFQRTTSITTTASPYVSQPPTGGTVPTTNSNNAQNSGGGVTFSTFTSGSYDNILQVTNSQFSSLANNWGSNGETESLFLTGFPVYDQASGQNQFELLGVGGAYEATFNKPIINTTGSNSVNINVPIRLLGQNYTIVNETGVKSGAGSTTAINGGKLTIASSIAPLATVYVGHNITAGSWTVQLQDLAQTNNGLNAPAAVAVYYNGVQTNETTINPGTSGATVKVNVTGHLLFINVQSTFAGLYAYQKWAKIQLYAGVYNLQDGHQFNATNDKGWNVNLLWTNTTSGSYGNALRSIVVYNASPTTLKQGGTFTFIQMPAEYKLTFVGDTLGNNYDPVTATLSEINEVYANAGAGAGAHGNPNNITEPSQVLTVTSGITNAFTYGGQTSSQITYDLTPYSLAYTANANAYAANGDGANVVLSYVTADAANFINSNNILYVVVSGFTSNTATSATTEPQVQFTANTANAVLQTPLYNVTSIAIQNNRALPITSGGTFSITVGNVLATANTLSALSETTPIELLKPSNGNTYNQTYTTPNGNTIYNQQNGQQTAVTLTSTAGTLTNKVRQYYTFNVVEEPVPQNTIAQDSLGFGIYNTTQGNGQTQLLEMNYSTVGQSNNATYWSSQGYIIPVQTGFRTEKGSKVGSIGQLSDTFDMATSVDQLQFSLQNAASNVVVSRSSKTFGPYTVGQATNLANVSIAAVNATPVLSGSSTYTILGTANLTATPSVTEAVTPVLLKNLSSTAPLVVLDSDANSGSNLILVGSGYVNSLSSTLQSAYNVQVSPTSAPIVQAYGGNRILVAGYYANQTTSAANSFIDQLYAAAATST